MSKKPPYPYRTQPPSPPRKPAGGGGTNESFSDEERRVREQVSKVVYELWVKFNELFTKSDEIDTGMDLLWQELLDVYVEAVEAKKAGDIVKLRSLIPRAEKLVDELLKKLEVAREFTDQVFVIWPSIEKETINRIKDILNASSLPKDIRRKLYKEYVINAMEKIDQIGPPISTFGLWYSYYESQFTSILEEMKKMEAELSRSYKKV